MKPIIFSTPMVQAILDGRKTQTRRVIKPQPSNGVRKSVFVKSGLEDGHGREIKLRYPPGTVLWVRETWQYVYDVDNATDRCIEDTGRYVYYADDSMPFTHWVDSETGEHKERMPWRPSIHMPKDAARLFLQVKDVRVERLQDILISDMLAEGCVPKGVKGGQWQQWQKDYFMPFWDSLNAKRGYPFSSNPWVWKYVFERTDLK